MFITVYLLSSQMKLIIGNPKKKGETTLPETISCGDLDGDVYLICWSKTVVGYIEAANKNRIVHVFNCRIRDDYGDKLWAFADTFMGKRRSYEAIQLLKKLGARSAAARYVEENGTEPAVDHLRELLILESETVVTQDPSYEKKQFKRIIGHAVICKKVKMLVQWDSGTDCKVQTFEPLEQLLDAFPDNVVAYVKRQKQWRNSVDFKAVLVYLAKKKDNIAFALAHKRSLKKMGGTPSLAVAHGDINWFSKDQERMLDLAKRDKIYKFICILYQLCFASSTRAVDGSGDRDTNEEDIDNPDAMAYIRAYNRSLDIEKHVVQVPLRQNTRGALAVNFITCATGREDNRWRGAWTRFELNNVE
jgi:hypothetical protein